MLYRYWEGVVNPFVNSIYFIEEEKGKGESQEVEILNCISTPLDSLSSIDRPII